MTRRPDDTGSWALTRAQRQGTTRQGHRNEPSRPGVRPKRPRRSHDDGYRLASDEQPGSRKEEPNRHNRAAQRRGRRAEDGTSGMRPRSYLARPSPSLSLPERWSGWVSRPRRRAPDSNDESIARAVSFAELQSATVRGGCLPFDLSTMEVTMALRNEALDLIQAENINIDSVYDL